ncbi:dicarboxylate/amino acid:cation symporter [Barrientosiimonas marina]|uniref:Dicarboxylate/amino acid:cation symporter n=1 Tax=Lentibacillus kimchii TaxID=1542911 RepID=A0ABW2UWH5_9BACI
MSLWTWYKQLSLAKKMTTGFILGLAAGLIFQDQTAFLEPLGTLFIHLLSLIAIPVIFLTVVLAVDSLNTKQLGRMGGKLLLYYMTTTAAAVFIGVSLALWIKPGEGVTLPDADVSQPDTPTFSDMLFKIVPENIFQAFANGDLMAILFIAIIVGIATSIMRYTSNEQSNQYGEMLHKLFSALNEMFYKILGGVLLYAPVGIFAISATSFGGQGWETLKSLLTFLGVFYAGVALVMLVVYTSFLKLSGHHVISFFKQAKDAYITAFVTSSSIASLPVAINAAKKAGVSDTTANFALPLGSVFNADGGALRMGVSIVFAANITGLDLAPADLVVVVLIGTLLSIGTAGVPAAGLVTLSVVLTMFGLPMEIVALISGIDALIGMAGTASNVMGDVVGAAVIDRTESKHRQQT